VLHPGDPHRQTLAAFRIALDALQAEGVAPEQVVGTRLYVTDITAQTEVGARIRKCSATFGQWQPWSRWRGLPILTIGSRPRLRRTSEAEHPDIPNGRLTAVIKRLRIRLRI
jgi:hypothetical protein